MSEPKRHHYLPQSYLENFSNNGGVWVYNDKDKTIKKIPKLNVAVISHFYTRENEDGTKDYELEKKLSVIESEASNIIKKLISKEQISLEEKGKFALYIALLQHRTPFAIDKLHQFTDPVLEWMHKIRENNGTYEKFIDENEFECRLSKDFQKKLIKLSKITLTKTGEWGLLFDTAIHIAKLYSQMDWHFIYTTKSTFITSDNPLIYYEPKFDTGVYGYGIATPTVENLYL